ncbi:hypothetical protein [Spirillospora sp. NPDC047279]|uniref:hypothetical protein n=1 Tax=Spirillospora sp. NPDC047279 TaxID=3155478 RepID=UPI003402A4BE
MRDENGTRHLSARLTDDGDLVIEGHDLGRGVESFGPGLREYEWVWTVRAEHVPKLAEVLEAGPGEAILAVLQRTCSGDDASRLSALLGRGKPVPAERWSRLGD